MPDTTERPPAREVLARHMSKAQGQDPDVMTKGQPVWERYHGSNADGHLTALAAAGYPVEATAKLVEALEGSDPDWLMKLYNFLLSYFEADQDTGHAVTGNARPHFEALCEFMAARDAALALAKQEPQP